MKKLIPSTILAITLGMAFAPSAYSNEEKSQNNIAVSQSALININTATSSQLQNLPGIGKKKAQAIIDYRSENGRFLSVEELSNVKGIGKKMVDKLTDKVNAG
jgi:competence protein ComEA